MKAIPIYNFRELSGEAIIGKADHIIASMTGNPKFPDATARVTKVQTARDEFATALTNAKDGGKTKTAVKNDKRKTLQAALKELALYVQLTSNGDLAMMLSSGYDGKGDGEPSKDPGPPKNFIAKPGRVPGSVDVSIEGYTHIRTFVFQYALVPESGQPVWTTLPGPKSRTIRDLISGKQYMFRGALQNLNEILEYSAIVYLYVS
ncbi:MAG TPA: hypothetical protein VHO66_01165 [Ruminiclostridium sp.]|nr:hypothetical protein [Ruminiclostridium sp.]